MSFRSHNVSGLSQTAGIKHNSMQIIKCSYSYSLGTKIKGGENTFHNIDVLDDIKGIYPIKLYSIFVTLLMRLTY